MAVKPKPQREAPAPLPKQSRAQLGKSLQALAGLAAPKKTPLKGK